MGLLCFLLTVSGVRPSGEVLKPEKFVGRLTGSDFREASRPIKPGTGDLAGDRERRAVFDLMARGRHDRRRAIGTAMAIVWTILNSSTGFAPRNFANQPGCVVTGTIVGPK
jgi:hypothetical protein